MLHLTPHSNPRKNLSIFKIIGLLMILGVASELALRFYMKLQPRTQAESILDERGFPNAPGVTQADLVLLGDFQNTQGRALLGGKSFEALTGHSTYLVSKPGMGLTEAYESLNTALSLRPKIVLLRLDLAVDFLNAFHAVYHDRRIYHFRNLEETQSRAWEQMENQNSLSKLRVEYQALVKDVRGGADSGEDPLCSLKATKCPFRSSAWYQWVQSWKCRASGTQISMKQRNETDWSTLKARAEQHPERVEIAENSSFHTLLYPRHRLGMVDRQDPRIVEGYRIVTEVIRDISTRVHAQGGQLLCVFSPSKESVVAHALRFDEEKISSDLKKSVEEEDYFRSKLVTFLDALFIAQLDLLVPLAQGYEKGRAVYHAEDHRLSLNGWTLLGDTLVEGVRQLNSQESGKKPLKEPWEYQHFRDRNKDFELKLMVAVLALGFIAVLLLTRSRQTLRPVILLCMYGFYLMFQSLYMIEFFPITAFQMYSFPEEKVVLYDKLIPVLQDGSVVQMRDHTVLPMLADGRSKRYVEDSLKNPEVAHEFASAFAKAYAKKFQKPGTPGIAEVRLERWKWNFIEDPQDPLKGFVVKRVVGKPYEEPSHV